MQHDIYVAGAGMTTFGKQLERGLRSLAEEAVRDALADAGAGPEVVDHVFFANAVAGLITGQACVPGQVALRHTGLLGIPIVNVENACASGSTAFGLACTQLMAGTADVVMVVGAEKLSHADKARSFAAFSAGYDQEEPPSAAPPAVEGAPTRSVFMDVYAQMAHQYMARSGAVAEDFAQVAVKAHRHGALNPKAQYGDPLTVDGVLGSRTIVDPLTLMMCSPLSDGAAALVLANERGLKRLNADPVRVLAATLVSGRDRTNGDRTAVERAARDAYEVAGVAAADIDVIELHDAAAPAELIVSEELGLCEPGGGPELLRSGATTIGGRVPINPSGGLLSKGHPVGATGCAQIVELVDQLRGRCGGRQVEGAKIALAENGGGYLENDAAVATVTILAR
ncbi:thiolase family protein [Paraconexibacter antarcticus]|uniref:propanoyl-CoA C-acyltransferase n=1 Tax=Paraconexibacter antarcticus TaxID=2949664 RepID=A0ABY5E1K0_9ACTN|nr:thiolase family protein [Paraconexibacter antarcticus]UTI66690.1 thiolase family protein [Paraconexibacter antarcticus]